MIRINLLPIEAESAPTPINPALPIGVFGAAAIAVVIVIHSAQATSRQKLHADDEKLKQQLQQYQLLTAEVDQLEQAKQQLNNRKSVIQQLESERLRYPQFMDDFIKLLPGNLWLSNLTTTLSPQPNTMTVGMDVTALDNYAIADLIANLETSQIFTDVDLGPIAASQQTTGGQTMNFHLNTTYRKLNPLTDATKKP